MTWFGKWEVAKGNVCLFVFFLALGSLQTEAVEVSREVLAMGTRLTVSVTADESGDAWRAAEAAIRAVDEVEQRLSSWRADSDISRINRAGVGQWVDVSPKTTKNLETAKRWSRKTEGAFNPGVGAMVSAWLGGGARTAVVPSEIEMMRLAIDPENLEIEGSRVRRLQGLLQLDAGAFGKGVALTEAARSGVEAGAVCIDLNFGGQVMRAGTCQEVHILIADPQYRGDSVADCRLTTGSLATSGNSERGVDVAGDRIGHIIDPRTGQPSSFRGSVTVRSEDPVAADVLSTALFVMGPQSGRDWIESVTDLDIEASWISSGGEVMWSTPGFGIDE